MNSLASFFKLQEHGTTYQREIVGGVTTFLAMSYIIFVQPGVLSAAGMDFQAVLTATCLAAAASTLLMGLLANYPVALAPGMGENFFFALYALRRHPLGIWPHLAAGAGGGAAGGDFLHCHYPYRPARANCELDSPFAEVQHRRGNRPVHYVYRARIRRAGGGFARHAGAHGRFAPTGGAGHRRGPSADRGAVELPRPRRHPDRDSRQHRDLLRSWGWSIARDCSRCNFTWRRHSGNSI